MSIGYVTANSFHMHQVSALSSLPSTIPTADMDDLTSAAVGASPVPVSGDKASRHLRRREVTTSDTTAAAIPRMGGKLNRLVFKPIIGILA